MDDTTQKEVGSRVAFAASFGLVSLRHVNFGGIQSRRRPHWCSDLGLDKQRSRSLEANGRNALRPLGSSRLDIPSGLALVLCRLTETLGHMKMDFTRARIKHQNIVSA